MAMLRVNVGLPPRVHQIVETELKGKLGFEKSEILRNIIMIYLSERGYFREFLINGEIKKEPKT